MEGRVIPDGRFCVGMFGLALLPMFILGLLGMAGLDICAGAGRDIPPIGRAPPQPPLGIAGRDILPMGRALTPAPPPGRAR